MNFTLRDGPLQCTSAPVAPGLVASAGAPVQDAFNALYADDDDGDALSDEELETPSESRTFSGRRRRPKRQSRAERELDALWVDINVHKTARDKLYVELKSLQGSSWKARKAQIRVMIGHECNALDALHTRKDEVRAARAVAQRSSRRKR